MQHCIATLRVKEVINKKDGCRLGHVCDVEIDVCSGQVACLIVCRGGKWLGRCGFGDELHIPWCDVDVVGDDTILVCYNPPPPPPPCKPSPRRRFGFFQ